VTDRDANGRFVAGQSGNPNGRPPKAREERFKQITLSACSFKDWEEIVKKAVLQAKRGDATARKWLSDYLIGPPRAELDVTSGGEPLVLRYVNNWRDSTTLPPSGAEDGAA